MAEEEKDHAEEEEEDEEEAARRDGGRVEALAAERAREAREAAARGHDGDGVKKAHAEAHEAAHHDDGHHGYTPLEHAGIAATGVGITAGIFTRDTIKAFFTSLWHTGKAFVTGKDSAGLHGWKPKPAKHGGAGHAAAHGGGGEHKEHKEEHHDERHGKGGGHGKEHGGEHDHGGGKH